MRENLSSSWMEALWNPQAARTCLSRHLARRRLVILDTGESELRTMNISTYMYIATVSKELYLHNTIYTSAYIYMHVHRHTHKYKNLFSFQVIYVMLCKQCLFIYTSHTCHIQFMEFYMYIDCTCTLWNSKHTVNNSIYALYYAVYSWHGCTCMYVCVHFKLCWWRGLWHTDRQLVQLHVHA